MLIRGLEPRAGLQTRSSCGPHLPRPHLQLGRLRLQRGVVLLQESALFLQRQDLTAEGHVLGLQVLQLVPEQLLLGLQSCILGESTGASDTASTWDLGCKGPSRLEALGAKARAHQVRETTFSFLEKAVNRTGGKRPQAPILGVCAFKTENTPKRDSAQNRAHECEK